MEEKKNMRYVAIAYVIDESNAGELHRKLVELAQQYGVDSVGKNVSLDLVEKENGKEKQE